MKPCAVLPKWAQRSLDAPLQLLDGLDHEKSVFPGLTGTFLLFVLRRGWESDDAVSSHLRFRERQPRMCRPQRLLKPFSWPFELNQHFSVVWLVFQQMARLFLLSPFLQLFPLLWLYLFFPFVFPFALLALLSFAIFSFTPTFAMTDLTDLHGIRVLACGGTCIRC